MKKISTTPETMEDHAKASVMVGINAMTDFSDPVSIMSTSAMMLQTALNMYSMVLTKEDMRELLDMARHQLEENVEDTIYH
jgi:hypothetical protein